MSKTITTGTLNGVAIGGIPINTSLPSHRGNHSQYGASRTVGYVVMHYTGNNRDTALGNANYFMGERGVSAHLFVDETSIYQSVDLRAQAWHCGADRYYHTECRNYNSIGIEMCCSGGYKVSAKTKEIAAQLCAYICQLIGVDASGVDKYVLRHWDVSHKNCPAQMAGENNQEWTAFKARVKQILNHMKGEDDMTAAEVKKIIAEELDKREPIYKRLEDVPSYWREAIGQLVEQGAIAGTGKGELNMTKSEARVLFVMAKMLEGGKKRSNK